MTHKLTARCKFASSYTITALVATWVVDKSHWCIIADAVAHLELPSKSDEVASSGPSSLSGAVLDVLGMDLNVEDDWDLPNISHYGVIDIFSSLREGFSLIHKKCDEISIKRPFNARDVFRLAFPA